MRTQAIFNRCILTATFWLVVLVSSFAQQSVVGYEYWYDDDHTSALFVPTATQEVVHINTTLATTDLAPGIHLLHFRAKDDLGRFSVVKSQFFLKIPESGVSEREIVAYEYWFDDAHASAMTLPLSSNQTVTLNADLVADGVSNGIHLMHLRFKDSSGQWSSVTTYFFLKTPETTGTTSEMVTYRYWLGTDLANAVYGQFSPTETVVQLDEQLDMTNLTEGEHIIHFQHKDDAGRWSTAMTDTFERVQITVDVIENEPEHGLELYPNPTNGELTVNVDAPYDHIDLRVFDARGSLLQSERYRSMSAIRFVLEQPSGTYLLEVITDDVKRSIFQVIKH